MTSRERDWCKVGTHRPFGARRSEFDPRVFDSLPQRPYSSKIERAPGNTARRCRLDPCYGFLIMNGGTGNV